MTMSPFSTTPTTCCAVLVLIGKMEPLLVASDSLMVSGMPGAGTPRALAGARTLVILNVRVPPRVPGAMMGTPLNTMEFGDAAPASWPCQTLAMPGCLYGLRLLAPNPGTSHGVTGCTGHSTCSAGSGSSTSNRASVAPLAVFKTRLVTVGVFKKS